MQEFALLVEVSMEVGLGIWLGSIFPCERGGVLGVCDALTNYTMNTTRHTPIGLWTGAAEADMVFGTGG